METRKYAHISPEKTENNNIIDETQNSEQNSGKNGDKNGILVGINTDENDTEKRRKTVNKRNAQNESKNENFLVCNYYCRLTQYSDLGSNLGIKRACVLLGTNGTNDNLFKL